MFFYRFIDVRKKNGHVLQASKAKFLGEILESNIGTSADEIPVKRKEAC